jgi:CheY-like chemotaxis protein
MSAKILVVDDNPTNLKLVSDVLAFEGHDILKAVDAEEAQLVLADTLLPTATLAMVFAPSATKSTSRPC